MGVYRDYISDDTDMQTMLFRYSIMVDVFNAHLPAELKCQYHLSDDLKKKILRQPYSEQVDRLILLFGMGVIGENTLKELVLHNKQIFFQMLLSLKPRYELMKVRMMNPKDCLTKLLNVSFCFVPILRSMMNFQILPLNRQKGLFQAVILLQKMVS